MKRFRIIDRHPYRSERDGWDRREISALNAVDAVRRYARFYGIKGHVRVLVAPVDAGPVEAVALHCSPQRRWRRW